MNHMGGSERRYVEDAFDTDWIVPLGPHVDEFERRLSAVMSGRPVLALSAGTAALHLALVALGVDRGDEVICQDLTFAASANPIAYQGAAPVFVDSEDSTFNMDPDLLVEAIEQRRKITGRLPKAIIAVDLYGMPAQMERITAIAAAYGIPVVEDAAEALGSRLGGRPCGTFGTFGAISFNGNKIITTSGGGALICPGDEARRRALFFATQAREDRPYYYHEHIGFNYRLSNVCGAIGCGQMDVLDERVARRRHIHELYLEGLAGIGGLEVQQAPAEEYFSNYWLTTIQLHCTAPDVLRLALAAENIESRLLWRPMHMQPVFAGAPFYGGTTAQRLFEHGLCLPSGSILTDNDIARVIETIRRCLA